MRPCLPPVTSGARDVSLRVVERVSAWCVGPAAALERDTNIRQRATWSKHNHVLTSASCNPKKDLKSRAKRGTVTGAWGTRGPWTFAGRMDLAGHTPGPVPVLTVLLPLRT